MKQLNRGLVALTVIVIVGLCWYPPIQDLAHEQVDAGLKRAIVSFASARTLNAVISVLQGTEFSAQPFGVGVTLTLGQVLDPINDLVEQFSNWMLIASVAFGVQKMLLVIGAHKAVSIIVSAVAVAWAILYLAQRSPGWLSRLLVVLVLIRFAIPVATLGSEFVFEHVLAQDYRESQAALDLAAQEVSRHTQQAPQVPAAEADKSLWESLKDRIAAVTPNISASYDDIKRAAEDLPERVIKLIAIFVLQTLVIPVVLLWLMYRIAVGMARPPAPTS
jgi:hypothetical protein